MKRIPELDLLRAVAVILVMLLHSEATPITTRMGWAGVDLFFVLSGFLVSGLLFMEYKSTGKLRPARFLIRRGLKIYPAFYVVLALHVLYYWLKNIPVDPNQVFAEVLFFQNYREGLMGISWSLAIEEHFYILVLLAAWVLAVNSRWRSVRTIIVCCILVCLLCFAARWITFNLNGYLGVFVNDFPTHLRIDALAFGLMLSCMYHFRHAQFVSFFARNRKVLFSLSIVALLPVFFYERSTFIVNVFGYTSLYVGAGTLMALTLIFAAQIKSAFHKLYMRFLYRALIFTGQYSYTIYLCHFLVGTGVVSIVRKNISGNLPHILYITIYLVSCIAAGVLLSLGVEKPFLKMRETYFPRKNNASINRNHDSHGRDKKD